VTATMADPGQTIARRLATCAREGLRSGARTTSWILMLMVPVSLIVTLLHFSGLLGRFAALVAPLFGLFGLPGETTVAFITGSLVNVYSGIAAIGPVPLTTRQVSILAVMILICHNLLIEVPVQRKAGSAAWRIVAIRVGTAVGAALLLNLIMPADHDAARSRVAAAASAELPEVARAWALGTGVLVLKVVVLVIGLTVAQRVLDEFGVVRFLSRLLAPVPLVLGLPRRTAFLWMVANTLGLAYGAAVILDEVERGALDRREADLLNHSVAVCHSLLEDTLLFVALGASAFWIVVPRLVLATAVTWLRRLELRLWPDRPLRTGPPACCGNP